MINIKTRLRSCLFSFAAMLACCLVPATATTLDEIKARGKVVIGVKKDAPLFGLQKTDGTFVGMEVDLAQMVANHLGVELALIGLLSADRIDAVTTGRIDLTISSLGDTPERRELLTLVEPHYYSSGVNVMAKKKDGFKRWSDLKNHRVCGRRGSFYIRPITVKFSVDIVSFYSLAWAKDAVLDGSCEALVYDDILIVSDLKHPRWAEYEMPLETIYPSDWSVAIPAAEKGSEVEKRLSELIISWHRDGTLVALEKKWGLPPTRFVTSMHEKWIRKNSNGDWYCGVAIDKKTPPDCR